MFSPTVHECGVRDEHVLCFIINNDPAAISPQLLPIALIVVTV